MIYNQKLYENDLEAYKLPDYYHRKKEYSAYIKDDKAYYNPGRTFESPPKPRNIKFKIPIKLKKLDQEYFVSTHTKKELEAYLLELEKEATNLLLFIDEPKFLKTEDKNSTLNDNYPFAYYDPTKEDKVNRIKELKTQILFVKEKLGLPAEVDFYVTVKNNTFPLKSEDLLSHYNQSYSVLNKNITEPKIINGNLTELDDVYNIRNVHLVKEEKKNDPYNVFKNLNLGYHNQILDYIKKKEEKIVVEDKNCELNEESDDQQQKLLKVAFKRNSDEKFMTSHVKDSLEEKEDKR